jgi:hypothetical protein
LLHPSLVVGSLVVVVVDLIAVDVAWLSLFEPVVGPLFLVGQHAAELGDPVGRLWLVVFAQRKRVGNLH